MNPARIRTSSRGRRGLALVAIASLAFAALEAGPPAAHADEEDDFLTLQGQRTWTAYGDARPISPYFGTPGEHAPGVPFSRSYIDSTPGRAEAFASFYYPSEILEEGLLETTKLYHNPTMVRVNNPDIGRGTKGELAPAGPAGPRAAAEVPSRTDAVSDARAGVTTDAATLAAGTGRTAAHFNRDDLLVDEATATVQGLELAGSVRIGNLTSLLHVEYRLHQEPKVTYRLALSGVDAAGQTVVGAGAYGVTLAGQNVLAHELVDQFNSQADQFGKTFADLVARTSLRLVQPTVQHRDDGSWLVSGAALEARSDNKPFRAGGGDNVGLRLASVKAFAYLIAVGDGPAAPPSSETTPSEAKPTTQPAADMPRTGTWAVTR